MSILCTLYETFENYIATVKRFDYHDYIGQVWSKSENVHRCYKILTASMYIAEIINVFKQQIIHYAIHAVY